MQSFSQVSAVLMAAEGHLKSGVDPGSEAALRYAWKTQHACVPLLLPARICQCLPLSKLYAVPKQTRFRPQNSKKGSSTHTKDKLRISRTQSLLIALVSRFCTTYFPPWPKGENQVWRSTLALAALRRNHCCCFGHHVAELGHCEQRKRPMHAKWKKMTEKPCTGRLYQLSEALSRVAGLPVNSHVCRQHWDELRRKDVRCSCSNTRQKNPFSSGFKANSW